MHPPVPAKRAFQSLPAPHAHKNAHEQAPLSAKQSAGRPEQAQAAYKPGLSLVLACRQAWSAVHASALCRPSSDLSPGHLRPNGPSHGGAAPHLVQAPDSLSPGGLRQGSPVPHLSRRPRQVSKNLCRLTLPPMPCCKKFSVSSLHAGLAGSAQHQAQAQAANSEPQPRRARPRQRSPSADSGASSGAQRPSTTPAASRLALHSLKSST